ncbi:protein containing DUF164 [Candidatus Magnetobacterium bavaricum]|uniref:Protein containing DUF164 n=1 Tax=Candidatus Magnetobacterium bavaricum TaxID=29290 RepID=A0A0F3GZS6_9BACT|nr:protein containing DUF164 [Candidatus Magnetobacterium bavaricum]
MQAAGRQQAGRQQAGSRQMEADIMIEELSLLKEIQVLDTDIIKLKTRTQNLPRELNTFDQAYKEAKVDFDRLKAELDAAAKKRKEFERLVSEKVERIAKLKEKTNDIKTNKEYQSRLKEVEQVEKEKRTIEDEILLAMERTEVIEKALGSAQKRLNMETSKIEEKRSVIKKEIEMVEKELQTLLMKREALVKTLLDKAVYDKYTYLLQRKNSLAVVKADKEVCMGCYMNIPPQLFVEVMRNDRIITCPQCGRIMYYDDGKDRELEELEKGEHTHQQAL